MPRDGVAWVLGTKHWNNHGVDAGWAVEWDAGDALSPGPSIAICFDYGCTPSTPRQNVPQQKWDARSVLRTRLSVVTARREKTGADCARESAATRSQPDCTTPGRQWSLRARPRARHSPHSFGR